MLALDQIPIIYNTTEFLWTRRIKFLMMLLYLLRNNTNISGAMIIHKRTEDTVLSSFK